MNILRQGGVGGPAQNDVLHRHHLHAPPSQEERGVPEEDKHSAVAIRLNPKQNSGRFYIKTVINLLNICNGQWPWTISKPWGLLPIFMK